MTDYKKLYEDANKRVATRFGSDVARELFPEFYESDDEKIRKELIEFISQYSQGSFNLGIKDITFKKWLAWLKKQGEQIPANSAKTCKDEQKHDDKVEPKFKIGDFIADGYCRGKIVIITDDAYLLDTGQGIPFSCEHNAHLWTIEDAKDGDVLAIGNEYFLFKGKIKHNTSSVYISHCFLDSAGVFRVTNGVDCGEFFPIENGIRVHPATKEQRDLLFAKMADAGYKWDAEKKELKEIEQEETELPKGEDYAIDGLWQAIQILEHSLGEVDGWQSDDGILEHKCAIEAVKRLYKQKSTWSEEDKKIMSNIGTYLNRYGNLANNEKKAEEIYKSADWLKSLKNRVQSQQEWGEDDKEQLDRALYMMEQFNMTKSWDDVYNWLKSLKDRI